MYALKSALGGTDAPGTLMAKLKAFGVDVVARTAEGRRGVGQGSESVRYTSGEGPGRGADVDMKVKDKEAYTRGRPATAKGSKTGLQLSYFANGGRKRW